MLEVLKVLKQVVHGPWPKELQEALEEGKRVTFFRDSLDRTLLWARVEGRRFPLKEPGLLPIYRLDLDPNGARLEGGGVFAASGGLLLLRLEDRLGPKLTPPALRLLEAFGAEGLEGALERLRSLGEGEAVYEDSYLLFRSPEGGRYGLRRGALEMDPREAAALFFEGRLHLEVPDRDFRILGEGSSYTDCLSIESSRGEWRGELLLFSTYVPPVPRASLLMAEPVSPFLRYLGGEMAKRGEGSQRVRLVLQALSQEEDPLGALRDPGFWERVELEAALLGLASL